MSSTEIEQIVAQRVTNAIEVISIYEIKTRVTRDSMDWVIRQEAKVIKNANNKRIWESEHGEILAGSKTKDVKWLGHTLLGRATRKGMLENYPTVTSVSYITLVHALPLVAKQKPVVTYFRCGAQGNFKTLGRHLEEIHVTWAQFWKKPDKMANGHEDTKSDSDVMLIELIKDNDGELGENNKVLGEDEFEGDHFDKFPTRSELAYHKYLMSAPLPSMIVSNPIIVEGNPLNLKIPCNIRHVHIGRAYIDLDSPLNRMSRGCYNWIMTTRREPKKDSKSPNGINNFTGRVRGMPIFVGNFTYASDFMIVEEINSVIDPRMSPVGLGKPFVELSNMTYDSH
ncbi:hypothetical protein Tco_0860680 [Tanacetum coccineum]|uniref:MAK10-like protein n=1 Tax=Tanacetum coccineum TaxID=301880 RepID=A0ABQ5BJD9_9ASTR